MGATVWLEVDDGSGSECPDNSMLLQLETELASLAARLNVRPLTDFYGYGSLAAEAAAEFADELAEAGVEAPSATDVWFDAKEGLMSFQSLAAELRTQPQSLGFTPRRGQDHWPQMLAEELAYCEERLRSAATQGQGFRLQIVS